MGKRRIPGRVRKDSGQQRRIRQMAAFLGALAFVPVILQLYGLMIRQYDGYRQKALDNQTRLTEITPRRGMICDRNLQIMACSRSVENLYLNPRELRQNKVDLESMSQKLGEILGKDPQWILEQARDRKLRYKQIGSRLEPETAARIRSYMNEAAIAGIHLEPDTRRLYPFGSLASQVMGFCNASGTGVEGIEAYYDSLLTGTPGKVITTRGNNEMDMPFPHEDYGISHPGGNVILTLDTQVQACLENQLELAMRRYQVQNGAFGLVMNAKTGEILAMATLGGYDPNAYLEIADPETADELYKLEQEYLRAPEANRENGKKRYLEEKQKARLKQWRNRCLSDGYEPGSTFKVVTMASALDCGAIDLNTDFYCGGSEQIPGRAQKLHCWRHQGHGAEKTPQALQNSCNLAFAHIALKMGGETFYQYVQKFGIMEKTGIDLGGEGKGIFFDREIITNTEKWGTASLTSGSFGQTFKLTPIQLARAVGAVVNGGKLMEPYLVSQVVDEGGKPILIQEPTVTRQVIRPETSQTMCALLESVVTEGTAKNAAVYGYRIGGKTGTSEKIDVFDEDGQRVLDKIVSFVGVAPMDDPEYIVLVGLDTPSRSSGIYISGGAMAAPTVGAIFRDILPYLGVQPTYPPDAPEGKKITLECLEGRSLKDANIWLKSQGLTGVQLGEGQTVLCQIPAAGEIVPGGSQVLLYLTDKKQPDTLPEGREDHSPKVP